MILTIDESREFILDKYKDDVGENSNGSKWIDLFEVQEKLSTQFAPHLYEVFVYDLNRIIRTVKRMHSSDRPVLKFELNSFLRDISMAHILTQNHKTNKHLSNVDMVNPSNLLMFIDCAFFLNLPDDILALIQYYVRAINNAYYRLNSLDAPFGKDKIVKRVKSSVSLLQSIYRFSKAFPRNVDREMSVDLKSISRLSCRPDKVFT